MGHKFYARNRVFTLGGKQSPDVLGLLEAHEDVVCVKRNLNPLSYAPMSVDCYTTPFYNLSVCKYADIEDGHILGVAKKVDDHPPKYVDAMDFSKRYYDAMKKCIADCWKSDKFHVVLHSSGYDSRLISAIIVELRKERGNEWLGDILFVEAGGEYELFKQVMITEGWSEKYYTVYNDGVQPGDYYESAFDASTAPAQLNGFSAYPINLYDVIGKWCVDTGRTGDKEIQFITGYGSNETCGAIRSSALGTMRKMFDYYYFHGLSQFPRETALMPYFDIDVIETLYTYGRQHSIDTTRLHGGAGVSKRVLESLFPALHAVPKAYVDLAWVIERGYRTLSPRMFERVSNDYARSWYCANVAPSITPSPNIEYSEWWLRWSTAMTCERLISLGKRLEVA